MANIENELNQINTAIYGKDVRSSLAEGLIAINDQVNEVSNQNLVNCEKISKVDESLVNMQLEISNEVSNQDLVNCKKFSKVGESVANVQLEISNVESAVNTNTQNIKTLTTEIGNQSKANSLGGLTANSSPNLTNSWSMAEGNYFTFMNSSNNPLIGLNVSENTFAMHHSMCDNASIMQYTPKSNTDNSAPVIFDVPLQTTTNNKTLTLSEGNIYYNGARILYLDSNLNLCINSPDSTTGNDSQPLGNTNICGGLSTSGNISVSNGNYSGFQINSNNVLSGENQTLNINSGQGFSNVKIYGDAEFTKPIQAPNLTSLENSLSHVNLIGGSNYGENGITSSEYGFEEKHFYVEEGKTYTITGCGMVQNEGSTLWVDVVGNTWSENPLVEIKSTSKTIGSTTFTATQTGKFIVQLYAADKTPVTVYWYTICESSMPNSFWIPSPADAFDGHYSDNFATEFVRVVNNAGILSNDNFNTGCYLNTGIYYTQNNNVMASVTNSPVQVAGYIEVINTEYNVNAPVSGTGMIFQKVVTVQGAIYTRVCLNTSSGLVWSQWENVMGAQNTNMIALRAVGQGVTNLVIENNNLKNENKVLGKQVVDLTLNNQKTNEQVKTLAKTIIEMQLNK